jgi:hypothetical protein
LSFLGQIETAPNGDSVRIVIWSQIVLPSNLAESI